MSEKPVRLCVIGAGKHAARNIYPCLPQLKNAGVTANADLVLEKARLLADRHGIPSSHSDYRAMLDREKPDGVVICVGPDFHAQAALELLPLGFHIYTEKPPAGDASQARAVLEMQRRTGKICMTGFKKRFAPAYLKTKAIVTDARFGDPAALHILRTSGNYRNAGDPRSNYLLDSGIHVLDLAHWLYGPVRTVSAFKKPPANYAISLEFRSGSVGTLTLTDRMSYERGWEEVTVIGSGGICIQVDNSVEMVAFEKDTPFSAHKPDFVAGNSNSSVEMGFQGELQAFVDAIAGKAAPASGIESAYHTMQIIAAVEKSAALRTGVEIPEEESP